jgi:hypothetical protein
MPGSQMPGSHASVMPAIALTVAFAIGAAIGPHVANRVHDDGGGTVHAPSQPGHHSPTRGESDQSESIIHTRHAD